MEVDALADQSAGAPGTCVSSRPHFFHFRAVFDKNLTKIIGCWPKFRGWRPPVWEDLDPPLGCGGIVWILYLFLVSLLYKYIDS